MATTQRYSSRRPNHRNNQGHRARTHTYPHPSRYHQPPLLGVVPPSPPHGHPQHFPDWPPMHFHPPPPNEFGPPVESPWMGGSGGFPHSHSHSSAPSPSMGPTGNPWIDPSHHPPHPSGYDPHIHNNSYYDPQKGGAMDGGRNFNFGGDSFQSRDERRRVHDNMFHAAYEQEAKRPKRGGPEMMPVDPQTFQPTNGMALLEHSPHNGGSEQKEGDSSRLRTAPNRTFQSPGRLHAPLRPMVDVNKKLDVDNSTTISVLCYNLLAQDLIRKNMYLYDSHEPEMLSWDYRKINLFADLRASKADILCLQEVQQDHYETWFEPQLALHGYSSLYQCRTGHHSDGCAVFYRKSHLRLVEWTGLEYRKNTKVLNRDNVGILAKFSPLESSEDSGMFCVATTHLLFNPKAGEVKLAQISCLLAELYKMATIPGKQELLPVILCGDFNCTPNSPFLNFISSSRLDYSKVSAATIAGYFEEKSKSRVIPIPLLPDHLNIGPNCIYTNVQKKDGQQADISDSPTLSSSSVKMAERSTCMEGGVTQLSAQVKTMTDGTIASEGGESTLNTASVSSQQLSSLSNKETAVTGTTFVTQQNEEFKQDVVMSDRPSYRSRSARGAKAARGSGQSRSTSFSSSGSLLGATDFKNPFEGEPLSPRTPSMEWQPEETTNEQAFGEESAPKMAVDDKSEVSQKEEGGKDTSNSGRWKKNHKEATPGVLTHSFDFESAYPHLPSSVPSTVTTFHQSAFETVDYIFYTPVAAAGSAAGTCKSGFHLLTRKVLPSTHTLLDLGPQPHRFLSSDHLPLQAVFQLVWQKHL